MNVYQYGAESGAQRPLFGDFVTTRHAILPAGTACVFNTTTLNCVHRLQGHQGEISKVSFNAQGSRILTASGDKTAKLWDSATGLCLQVLYTTRTNKSCLLTCWYCSSVGKSTLRGLQSVFLLCSRLVCFAFPRDLVDVCNHTQ
ncbi:Dynein assembly factor with WDR repeat domains 1 [Geodia barretti]|uniref:Dynein assembly factor with WDR repeat domains 1 n=1 Tax=Geodia barretti TaxID=519541 RepID=A0AA35S2B8_GEOBA|nr:Dynein assembly factor with WDR repeat domains 1 [Geodia barretti]